MTKKPSSEPTSTPKLSQYLKDENPNRFQNPFQGLGKYLHSIKQPYYSLKEKYNSEFRRRYFINNIRPKIRMFKSGWGFGLFTVFSCYMCYLMDCSLSDMKREVFKNQNRREMQIERENQIVDNVINKKKNEPDYLQRPIVEISTSKRYKFEIDSDVSLGFGRDYEEEDDY